MTYSTALIIFLVVLFLIVANHGSNINKIFMALKIVIDRVDELTITLNSLNNSMDDYKSLQNKELQRINSKILETERRIDNNE